MDFSTLNRTELENVTEQLVQENVLLKSKLAKVNPKQKTLFSDYIVQWLEQRRYMLQSTTYQGYERIIKNHIVPYFSEKNIFLEDLTASNINQYYSYKMSQGLSANTIKRHHANIRLCLSSAVKFDIVSRNVATLAELPRVNQHSVKFYSSADLLILLKYSRKNIIYPVVLLCCLGLRRSEALGVTWSAINFENNTLRIFQKVVSLSGTPAKTESVLKNNSSNRELVLPPFIIKELNSVFLSQVEDMEKNYKRYNQENTDYVCVNHYGEILKPDYVSHAFKERIIERHQLKPITLKGLRHTCATLISMNGFNLKYIQEWLGHSTIKITADIYTHVDLSEKRAVANSLEGIFTGQNKNTR